MKKVSALVLLLSLSACAFKPAKQEQTPIPIPENNPVVKSYKVVKPASNIVTIAAAGDVMLGGTATPYLEQNGYDYPFDTTRSILSSADIAIINLETPLTNAGELLVEKKYRFRNPPEKVIPALENAGIDIVSLANNHTLDYGYSGLSDTLAALDTSKVAYHGAGENLTEARKAVVMQRNGQSIGFLAYSNTFPEEFWAGKNRPGVAFGHQHYVQADVEALVARGVDIIVVSFHWGREGTTELRPYQPLLAKTAIDAGADLVIGHHPHVLQEIEVYKEGVILYSLGNFVFGSFSNRVQESAIVTVKFENGKYAGLDVTPLLVNNFKVYFQPRLLTPEQGKKAFQDLKWVESKQ